MSNRQQRLIAEAFSSRVDSALRSKAGAVLRDASNLGHRLTAITKEAHALIVKAHAIGPEDLHDLYASQIDYDNGLTVLATWLQTAPPQLQQALDLLKDGLEANVPHHGEED